MARQKIHKEYYAIPAYQILARITNEKMAEMLGCSVRTYTDKIYGYSDFKAAEGKKLSEILGVPQESLFLT